MVISSKLTLVRHPAVLLAPPSVAVRIDCLSIEQQLADTYRFARPMRTPIASANALRSQPVDATVVQWWFERRRLHMSRGRGPQLREADKADVWREWKSGKNLREVAQALSRCVTAIQGRGVSLRRSGAQGPTPFAAVPLTLAEREEISRGICAELSIRQMAQEDGPSALEHQPGD